MKTPERIETDLCVIGGGSGGLSVAAGAVQMGARVVLIERGEMGGDCLNRGCVPSKALLAAAKRAQTHRTSGAFGVASDAPTIDFAAVNAHVKSVIAAIAPHDSQERFEGLGVQVIRASASFVAPREVSAGGHLISAKRFVIATGSRPAAPPIPGLAEAPYLTNETIFELTECPRRLIVIGAGPIGLEMAQAHRRLGAEVVVLEAATPLAKDDPALAAVVLERLLAEGVEIRSGVAASAVETTADGVVVRLDGGESIAGSHLLVAAGRTPNLDDLNLDAANVERNRQGVVVDSRLRSANRRVFAVGDAAGGLQFTHVAGYHAGIVIRNALFRLPARASTDHVPWVTYTDPELAQVGLTEAQAREKRGESVRAISWSFADNDRAQAERATDGRLKAIFDHRGRVLGATIVGAGAGELIQLWALALSNGLSAKDIAGMVAPYPTLGEVSKRAAGQYFVPRLFGARTRWIVRQLLRLG